VLLASPDFFASRFIQRDELPLLLSAEREGRITIQWIAVRPSGYLETPIQEFQALNNPSTPLATLESRDVEGALVDICWRLKNAIVERERAVDGGTSLRTMQVEGEAGPQMIYRKLRELQKAQSERDEFLSRNEQELRDITNSSLSIARMIFDFFVKRAERTEAHLKYDVTLLSALDVIRKAGVDPRVYDLPAFDEAIQAFRSRTVHQHQHEAAVKAMIASIKDMSANSPRT